MDELDMAALGAALVAAGLVVLGIAIVAAVRRAARTPVTRSLPRPTPPCGDTACRAWHCGCCGGHAHQIAERHRLVHTAQASTQRLGILRRPDWPEVHLLHPRPRPATQIWTVSDDT